MEKKKTAAITTGEKRKKERVKEMETYKHTTTNRPTYQLTSKPTYINGSRLMNAYKWPPNTEAMPTTNSQYAEH